MSTWELLDKPKVCAWWLDVLNFLSSCIVYYLIYEFSLVSAGLCFALTFGPLASAVFVVVKSHDLPFGDWIAVSSYKHWLESKLSDVVECTMLDSQDNVFDTDLSSALKLPDGLEFKKYKIKFIPSVVQNLDELPAKPARFVYVRVEYICNKYSSESDRQQLALFAQLAGSSLAKNGLYIPTRYFWLDTRASEMSPSMIIKLNMLLVAIGLPFLGPKASQCQLNMTVTGSVYISEE